MAAWNFTTDPVIIPINSCVYVVCNAIMITWTKSEMKSSERIARARTQSWSASSTQNTSHLNVQFSAQIRRISAQAPKCPSSFPFYVWPYRLFVPKWIILDLVSCFKWENESRSFSWFFFVRSHFTLHFSDAFFSRRSEADLPAGNVEANGKMHLTKMISFILRKKTTTTTTTTRSDWNFNCCPQFVWISGRPLIPCQFFSIHLTKAIYSNMITWKLSTFLFGNKYLHTDCVHRGGNGDGPNEGQGKVTFYSFSFSFHVYTSKSVVAITLLQLLPNLHEIINIHCKIARLIFFFFVVSFHFTNCAKK